jgi:hypothetical protein
MVALIGGKQGGHVAHEPDVVQIKREKRERT